ncbi:hypothetical protein MANES_03G204450v8 [Manihot esculenta]|uniref:Uncharacterized protein n=1 Tax=Manihot esculenta TaxID=3983 RepID=A0ACB7I3C1_MANES|nr:hypothetical protein MANES_03G204450v8 [Manihot esculenta]
MPIATANGSILTWGGFGIGQGHSGGNETVTGRACPKGLYGIFCEVFLLIPSCQFLVDHLNILNIL